MLQIFFNELCKYYIFNEALIRNQHFPFKKGICKLLTTLLPLLQEFIYEKFNDFH